MTKIEFRAALDRLLAEDVNGLEWEAKLALARHVLVQADKAHERVEENSRKPWTDDELRAILRTAPTRENRMQLARAFRRGYGSIEQIFRWAAEDDKAIAEKRPDHAFIQQITRVKREIGWIAT